MFFLWISAGLWPLKSIKLEPKTCSQRICFYSQSLPHSIWKSEQILSGCDCCEVNGNIVKEGSTWKEHGKVYECCNGDIVMKLDEASSSKPEPSTAAPTTSEPSTAAPSTPELSTAAPSTPELSTAAPSTLELSTAAPSTPELSTADPNTQIHSKGVLISGGNPSSRWRKVELYNPITKTSCSLPDLPADRFGHTSVGGVICGGGGTSTRTSCIDISSGRWSGTKYEATRRRFYHLVWYIKPGESFMLLGGRFNPKTTDIVHYNGKVEPGFNLQYDVYSACGISDDEDNTFIVTSGVISGGYSNKVVKYDKNGKFTDLPSLNTARNHHGCGTFKNKNNQKLWQVFDHLALWIQQKYWFMGQTHGRK